MFQKGTGERFKYKEAVIQKFPAAVCKRSPIKSFNGNTASRYLYAVHDGEKRISEAKYTAENAWADTWLKLVKEDDRKVRK